MKLNILLLPLPGGRSAAQHGVVALLSLFATAEVLAQDQSADDERLVVVGDRVYPVVDSVAPSLESAVDTAELLRALPGADLNANGSLTGLAQYRGLFGDRVAVSIDGLGMITGGPNSMDAPLSYASPLLLEHLSLERGIASVARSTESIGGHVTVDFDRGSHGERSAFAPSGKVQARYATNGNVQSTAFRLVGANETHKLALLGQIDSGDDLEFPGGTLTPTRLERDRFDLSYGYRNDTTSALIGIGRLETTDTGTPALPMDIRTIDTDMYQLQLTHRLGDAAEIDASVGYADVFHVMDNFALRTPPASPMGFRSNEAVGDGYHWRFGSTLEHESGVWQFGLDGQTADHSSTITNPNVPAFEIINFNAAMRDIVGLYGQWTGQSGPFDLEAGMRFNRVQVDAGPVGASIPPMNPMMQMMAMNAGMLADAFNASKRDRTHDNVDVVFKIGRNLSGMRNVYLEVARKTRAPSYQELFLWLPLQATGGLADGRSYIGNVALRSEVSREINLGSNWQAQRAWVAPQLFYKDISDYIQGVPSTNAIANMIAMMMTGRPALEFANTDAEIYGIDLGWGVYLSDRLTLDGVVTHARGRRTDVPDSLYRLAPLNGRIGLSFDREDWLARVEAVIYASQDKVASYNEETSTPGYGIVNASIQWQAHRNLVVTATASNLFDKRYQDHLDGINRVAGVDVPLGERLYGIGRSLQAGVTVSW